MEYKNWNLLPWTRIYKGARARSMSSEVGVQRSLNQLMGFLHRRNMLTPGVVIPGEPCLNQGSGRLNSTLGITFGIPVPWLCNSTLGFAIVTDSLLGLCAQCHTRVHTLYRCCRSHTPAHGSCC